MLQESEFDNTQAEKKIKYGLCCGAFLQLLRLRDAGI